MQSRFEQFIRERQFLSNVCASTLEWYKHSFKWLNSERPKDDDLKDAVLRMREKGLKATGCNSAIRAINAYLKWSGSAQKIRQLKEPQLVLPTFTPQQIRLLVAWKPKGNISVGYICLFSFCLIPDAASAKHSRSAFVRLTWTICS
jgi:integrase/recombinase XerD